MDYAKGYLQRDELDKAVSAVIPLLGPDVERLRYTVDEDWSGDPALFFKIVLSEEARRDDRLLAATRRIQAAIDRPLEPLIEWGLLRYINYRSHAEFSARQDKAWV